MPAEATTEKREEKTVKARVLFDAISYKDADGSRHRAEQGDEVELPASEFDRLTSDEVKLPPTADQPEGRYPVEKAK